MPLIDGYCLECEKIEPIKGRGLCVKCWALHRSKGTLHCFNKAPLVIERYQEFLILKSAKPKLTHKQIAEKIGVVDKTIDRYNAHLQGRVKINCLIEVGL